MDISAHVFHVSAQVMIVDAHCHLGREGAKRQAADELLSEMDRLKVGKAVICPGDREIAVLNDEGNRRIAEMVRSHPDRFAGMAAVNPWYGDEALAILGRAADDGLRGIKLHPPLQGFQLSDELVDPLIGFARDAGWPVYAHTGTPICAEPLQLTELARRHPDVIFIMGHMGWSDFAYDTINAAAMAGNIVLETSHMVCAVIEQAVGEFGASRVMFGSDSPVSTLEAELAKFSIADLNHADRDKALGGTAVNLFGLEP